MSQTKMPSLPIDHVILGTPLHIITELAYYALRVNLRHLTQKSAKDVLFILTVMKVALHRVNLVFRSPEQKNLDHLLATVVLATKTTTH